MLPKQRYSSPNIKNPDWKSNGKKIYLANITESTAFGKIFVLLLIFATNTITASVDL